MEGPPNPELHPSEANSEDIYSELFDIKLKETSLDSPEYLSVLRNSVFNGITINEAFLSQSVLSLVAKKEFWELLTTACEGLEDCTFEHLHIASENKSKPHVDLVKCGGKGHPTVRLLQVKSKAAGKHKAKQKNMVALKLIEVVCPQLFGFVRGKFCNGEYMESQSLLGDPMTDMIEQKKEEGPPLDVIDDQSVEQHSFGEMPQEEETEPKIVEERQRAIDVETTDLKFQEPQISSDSKTENQTSSYSTTNYTDSKAKEAEAEKDLTQLTIETNVATEPPLDPVDRETPEGGEIEANKAYMTTVDIFEEYCFEEVQWFDDLRPLKLFVGECRATCRGCNVVAGETGFVKAMHSYLGRKGLYLRSIPFDAKEGPGVRLTINDSTNSFVAVLDLPGKSVEEEEDWIAKGVLYLLKCVLPQVYSRIAANSIRDRLNNLGGSENCTRNVSGKTTPKLGINSKAKGLHMDCDLMFSGRKVNKLATQEAPKRKDTEMRESSSKTIKLNESYEKQERQKMVLESLGKCKWSDLKPEVHVEKFTKRVVDNASYKITKVEFSESLKAIRNHISGQMHWKKDEWKEAEEAMKLFLESASESIPYIVKEMLMILANVKPEIKVDKESLRYFVVRLPADDSNYKEQNLLSVTFSTAGKKMNEQRRLEDCFETACYLILYRLLVKELYFKLVGKLILPK
jgi:hypothetical protein